MKSVFFKSCIATISFAMVAGCGSSSGSSTGSSTALFGIAVDDVTTPTKLYLSNFGTDGIGSVAIAGGSTTSMTNSTAGFNGPEGLLLMGGNLYVVDALNHAVRQVTTASPYTTSTYAGTLSSQGNSDSTTTYPGGLFSFPRNAVADRLGNLYVTDSGNGTVRMIASGTKTVSTIASGFVNPWGITIDNATPQNMYVTDSSSSLQQANAVKKLTLSGTTWNVSVFAGSVSGASGKPSATTVNGTSALFNNPLGITTDNTYLYVVDTGNNAIRRIKLSTADVDLMAGSSAGTAGNAVNNAGASALFSSPYAIAYADGAVYVTDQGGTAIRKVSTTTPYAVSTVPLN